jgi:hypothetical protein
MAYTTIKKPSDYFNTKLYTGTGSTQSITGVGFQPDWTWIKNRSITANHHVFDVIRGATKYILTNSTNAEATDAQQLQSFDSDGFTVGTNGNVNGSGNNIVAWNWLGANGTASNTDGSITSTVSANTTSGFSIVRYTATGSATNFGHGLGTAPSVVIIKDINGTTGSGWLVGHAAIGMTNYLKLNTTAQSVSSTAVFSQNASSSLVYIGNSAAVSESGKDYIAYCFADVKGFSKFGSYTGNGNADGTFVYTGFKPAFVMVKRTDSSTGGSWIMFDTKRNPYNVSDIVLASNDASSEAGWGYAYDLDILSNGFKWRNDGGSGYVNVSGASYIYMAFAEEPLVGDNPATAR